MFDHFTFNLVRVQSFNFLELESIPKTLQSGNKCIMKNQRSVTEIHVLHTKEKLHNNPTSNFICYICQVLFDAR